MIHMMERKIKMSNYEFQKVNSRVIRSGDNYLAKVDSAENFSSVFVDEETTYGVSVRDAQIQTGDSTYTPAMAFTYSMEDGSVRFIDVVVCQLLGTFVSDWY